MARDPIELTPAEWTIIKAVWSHEPCTAPMIQGQLKRKTRWSYSTVRTIMDRMVAKGLLRSEKSRKVTLFRSGVTRGEAQRSELLYALRHAFNGALTPMIQCLLNSKEISAEELAELEAMIKARKDNAREQASRPRQNELVNCYHEPLGESGAGVCLADALAIEHADRAPHGVGSQLTEKGPRRGAVRLVDACSR